MRGVDLDHPCAGCGKSTAPGQARFADRRKIAHADGTRSYLCGNCDGVAAASRKEGQLSDEELRQLIEDGSMMGVLLSGGGLGVGL